MYENDRLIKLPRPPVPGRPTRTWEYIVAYLCIWFLAVALILVYFTSTGSPQAGLIEVGIFTSIFVFLFHLVIRFFPFIAKIFSSVVIIGLGIALIYGNYYFLKIVKKDAPFEQLLIGDLLVNKIIKTTKEDQITVDAKKEREILKYEKPLVSLNQLERPISNPTMAGLQLSPVIPPIHTVKAGLISLIEKYKTEVPRYETSMPVVPLNQLKEFTSGPLKAKWELPYITITIPMMKALPIFASEKDKTETPISSMSTKASHLEFTIKSEPMIQESLERNGFNLLPLLKSIQEITMIRKVPEIQPPLSGTTISFPTINFKEPLEENRIPID
jgi:hypothetical protein